MKKIYNQIIADTLERSDEHSITKEEAIDRISEVSEVYYDDQYEMLECGKPGMFITYVRKYYPQFIETTWPN